MSDSKPVFHPEARNTYTLKELLDNGLQYMQNSDVAPPGAHQISKATSDAIIAFYGADTVVPGAINDLVGRGLVHMVGVIGTINRVMELMKDQNGDVLRVYKALEEEGLLLASPSLYAKD